MNKRDLRYNVDEKEKKKPLIFRHHYYTVRIFRLSI